MVSFAQEKNPVFAFAHLLSKGSWTGEDSATWQRMEDPAFIVTKIKKLKADYLKDWQLWYHSF